MAPPCTESFQTAEQTKGRRGPGSRNPLGEQRRDLAALSTHVYLRELQGKKARLRASAKQSADGVGSGR